MKHALGVIVTATLLGLASFPAAASERAKANTAGKVRPASQTTAVQPQPQAQTATPSGDTLVHRGFQGWANGMNRAARAMGLDKDPLEGRLPGGNSGSRRAAADGPFDHDTLR